MAKKTIEELRNQFKTPENNNGGSRPNNYYPFWNMKEGEQAVVRFLPDMNDDNPLGFMVEKLTHVLEINGNKKTIPCIKMYDPDPRACPICNVSKEYYDADDKVNGKKYYRRKQHIVQALIMEDPLPEGDDGEKHTGKVRYMSLGYQLFAIIKAAFEAGELDEIPYSYDGGCNFIIKKTKSGDYPSYQFGTNFARKSTDLTEDEVAVAEDGMVELNTLLPANPGIEAVDGMLEAAMNGGTYEAPGDDSESSTVDFKAAPKKKAAKPAATEPEAKAETADSSSDTEAAADDILAKIRSRKKS